MCKKILTFSFCLLMSTIVLAKAGIDVMVYNNSSSPTLFTQIDNNGKQINCITVPPYKTYFLSYVTTKRTSYLVLDPQKTVNITVQRNGQNVGDITFTLTNGYTNNEYKVNKIEGNIDVDVMKKTWHNWYGTPRITITYSPTKIDLRNSRLFDNISRVIIFGDSLSDKGNLYNFTQGILPSSEYYYNGMFSNSDVWAARFSKDLEKYNIKVSDYAVGGATAVRNIDTKHLPYSLEQEMEVFKLNATMEGWKNFGDILAFTWIGGNDYLTLSPNTTVDKQSMISDNAINAIKKNTDQLIKMGVNTFVYVTLPDLSLTPESRLDLKNTEVVHNLTLIHNDKLTNLISEYKAQYPYKKFELIDMKSILDNIYNYPEFFNQKYNTTITNLTDSFWTGGYISVGQLDVIGAISGDNNIAGDDPDNYLFWDRVHPTMQGHKILYYEILQALSVQILENSIENIQRGIYQ